MNDDACTYQYIVLVIVSSVRNLGQKKIGLNDSDRDDGTYRKIDASAQTTGEGGGSVASANDSTAGVCATDEYLGKGLKSMVSMHPWVWKMIACACHKRAEGEGVCGGERLAGMVDTDLCDYSQPRIEVP